MPASHQPADWYSVLEVPETASEEQIRAAYRALVAKYHPDRYEDHPLQELARERLQQINAAYAVLGDARRRAVYDRQRRGGFAGAGPSGVPGGVPLNMGLPAAWLRRLSQAATLVVMLMIVLRFGGVLLRGGVLAFGLLRSTPLGLLVACLGLVAGFVWLWRRRRQV